MTDDTIREAVARALTIADSDDPDRETGIKARPVLWMVNLEAADAAIAAYEAARAAPIPTTYLERARKLLGSDCRLNTCNFCGDIYPNPECDYIRKAQNAGKAIPCEAVGDTDLCTALAAEFAAIERETLERIIFPA